MARNPVLALAVAASVWFGCGQVAQNTDRTPQTRPDAGLPLQSPAGGDAGPERSSSSCNDLERTLGKQIVAVFAAADTACTADSDCVSVGWDFGCYFQCGGSVLSQSGAAAAEAAVEQSTAPVCSELASGCERPPPSTCPGGLGLGPAACISGVCQGLASSALSCDDLTSEASKRVANAAEKADHSCTTSDDCTKANASLRCIADCGNFPVVAKTASTALEASVQSVQDTFCKTYEARSCPAAIPPPCTPLPGTVQPSCVAGQCQSEFVPSG